MLARTALVGAIALALAAPASAHSPVAHTDWGKLTLKQQQHKLKIALAHHGGVVRVCRRIRSSARVCAWHGEAQQWTRESYRRVTRALAARKRASGPFGLPACTHELLMLEGGYDPHKRNREGSGAYGGPQALPGSKMASAGPDWRDNIWTQIRWMIGYVNERYGGMCNALAYRRANGYY